jgi:hypothetical protein
VDLDIPNEVKDVDKAEGEVNLKEKTETTSEGQPVNQIKQIGQSVPLTVAIQDPGLTKQKLSVIILEKWVIMLRITGI